MRHSRFLSSAALAATLCSLGACTSQTQKCSGGVCDIDLSGAGAVVELGGDGGSDLELVSASGQTARVKIAGREGELTVGQPVRLDNGSLELVAVEGEDDVQLKVTGSGDQPAATSGAGQ